MKKQMTKIRLCMALLAVLCSASASAQDKIWAYAGTYGVSGYEGDGYYAYTRPDSLRAKINLNTSATTMAFDAAGNLYFSDNSTVVRKVDAVTHVISTILGNSLDRDFSPSTGIGALGPLGSAESSPIGPALGLAYRKADNCLYIGSRYWVMKYNISTNVWTTIAGNTGYVSGVGYPGLGDGGPAVNAGLAFPFAMAFSKDERYLYMACYYNNKIRKIDLNTGTISNVAGNGSTTFAPFATGGKADTTTLFQPDKLAVDTNNNVYFANASSSTAYIYKVDAVTGILTRFAGGGVSDADGVLATNMRIGGSTLVRTLGFDVATNSLLYSSGNTVRKINLATNIVTTVVGNNTAGIVTPDDLDGTGADASVYCFTTATAIAKSPSGLLYVADFGASMVFQVSPTAPATGAAAAPAAGTLDCSKTMLSPAPVFGTAKQIDLVVTINITAAGSMAPITVSGSGMSVPIGTQTIFAAASGIQQLHIPVNYDGVTPLGTLTFTIGTAGTCTADLTKTPVNKQQQVWTLDNCTLMNASPALK